MGEIPGDATALASTLIDRLVVLGGGIAAAHRQFPPAVIEEMNYAAPHGERFRRLSPGHSTWKTRPSSRCF
jgi:hypothetical protein